MKHRILLLNPPKRMDEVYGKYKDSAGLTYLNGLAVLAGMAKREFGDDVEVKIVDAEVEDLTFAQVKDLFQTYQPHILGITSMTPLIYAAYRCATLMKEVDPGTMVLLGGPHMTEVPAEVMTECPSIDYGCIGEGEYTFLELIYHYKNKTKPDRSCLGIVYREGEKVIQTLDRPKIKDLDTLPFPDYGQFRMDLYRPPVHKYKIDNTFSIVTSRGCPYACTFCSTAVHTRRYRTYSPERVVEEMLHLKNNYGARGITIQDSLFTMHRKRVMEICKILIKEKIGVIWAANARVDQVDPELLSTMKKAGCWILAFGVENGNQHMLDQMKKGFKLPDAIKGIALAKKAGMETRASYILGLPGETEETAMNTIKFAKKVGTNVASFHFAVPYPGTELYKQCREDPNFKKIEWSRCILMGDKPLFVPSTISEEALVRLYEYAWKSYYFTPKVFVSNILKIRSMVDVKRYYTGFKTIFKKEDKHKEFSYA